MVERGAKRKSQGQGMGVMQKEQCMWPLSSGREWTGLTEGFRCEGLSTSFQCVACRVKGKHDIAFKASSIKAYA